MHINFNAINAPCFWVYRITDCALLLFSEFRVSLKKLFKSLKALEPQMIVQ